MSVESGASGEEVRGCQWGSCALVLCEASDVESRDVTKSVGKSAMPSGKKISVGVCVCVHAHMCVCVCCIHMCMYKPQRFQLFSPTFSLPWSAHTDWPSLAHTPSPVC